MPLTPQDVEALPTDADVLDALYEYGSAARYWVVTGDRAGAMDAAAEKVMARVRQVRASASATEAALRAERDEACEALAAMSDGADRIGGDGHGMPECPWCGRQDEGGDRSTDADLHDADCELLRARAVLARIRKETPDHE